MNENMLSDSFSVSNYAVDLYGKKAYFANPCVNVASSDHLFFCFTDEAVRRLQVDMF